MLQKSQMAWDVENLATLHMDEFGLIPRKKTDKIDFFKLQIHIVSFKIIALGDIQGWQQFLNSSLQYWNSDAEIAFIDRLRVTA